VALTLTLRHLWTSTDRPRSWRFSGEDEITIRDLLGGLDEFKAEPERHSAVLIAEMDDGTIFGAWNRAGAAHLRTAIGTQGELSSEWLALRNALDDGVTGP
jgi:hypothetical protein